jgi:hypothetical protein
MPHSSFQVAIVFFGGEELLLLLVQLLLPLLQLLLLLLLVQLLLLLLLLLLAFLSPVNPAGPNISFPFREGHNPGQIGFATRWLLSKKKKN